MPLYGRNNRISKALFAATICGLVSFNCGSSQLEIRSTVERDKALTRLTSVVGSGDWSAAASEAELLARTLSSSGFATSETLSRIEVIRAVAHFNLGDQPRALWHWHAAQNLSSDAAARAVLDLGDYPKDFVGIGRPTLRPTTEPPDQINPSRPTFAIPPNRYVHADGSNRRRSLEVQFLIGPDGVPHSPRIVGSFGEDADLVFSALETLRQWRYSPAREDGRLIESPMTVRLIIDPSVSKLSRAITDKQEQIRP